MRILRIVSGAAVWTIVLPAVLVGQICEGQPPLTPGSFNFSGAVSFSYLGIGSGGAINFGARRDMYAAARFTYYDYAGSGLSSRAFALSVNRDFSSDGPWSVCPGIGASGQSGPRLGDTTFAVAPGVSVGVRFDDSEGVTVVPSASVFLVHPLLHSQVAELVPPDSYGGPAPVDPTEESRDAYALIDLGLSLISNMRFGLAASARFPIGFDGGRPSAGLGFRIPIGSS